MILYTLQALFLFVGTSYKNKYSKVSDIYDTYVNSNYDIDFWLKECSKEDEVLELTSGTGRVTLPLARAGIKVTALDISRELLLQLRNKCKKEKLKVEILEADMRDFNLGKQFPLVIIPFQSIQELTSPSDHERTFKTVRKHLAAGGRFLVSTHNTVLVSSKPSKLQMIGSYIHPKTKNRLEFWLSRKSNPKKHIGTAIQVYKEYNKAGKMVSRLVFRNSYYVFGKGEFEGLAKKTGFKIKNIYGDYSHKPFSQKSQYRIFELVE